METKRIGVVNRSHHPLPSYETKWASGLDVRANLEEPIIMEPLDRVAVPTGLYFDLPKGMEIQVRARSGLAFKKGLSLPNGIGTIDADYRGELQVLLINLSKENVVIEDGQRIAQIVFSSVEQVSLIDVDTLSETERNEGRFGHTGQ